MKVALCKSVLILQEELVSPLSPFATHSIAQSPEGAVGQRGSTKPPLGGLAGQSLPPVFSFCTHSFWRRHGLVNGLLLIHATCDKCRDQNTSYEEWSGEMCNGFYAMTGLTGV